MDITKRTNNNLKRKGIAIAWVVITLIVTLGIMALMIEGARIYLTSHHLQNSADAAALAGARYVPVYYDPNYSDIASTNARDIAIEYAKLNRTLGGEINLFRNDDNSGNKDIVIGSYAAQGGGFLPTPSSYSPGMNPNPAPNALKVVTRLDDDTELDGENNPPLAMRLGRIFGGQPKNLSRFAIAMVDYSDGAGLIALAPDGTGLSTWGTPFVNVEGGSIYVHSADQDEAIKFTGTPEFNSQDINVVGYSDATGGFDLVEDINYNDQSASLNEGFTPKEHPDPYWDLDEPSYASLPDRSLIDPNSGLTLEEPETWKITGGEPTLQPGYYSRGVEITGGSVTMEAGIYHFGGDLGKNNANGGFTIKGSANLDASAGVLLHIVENGELYIGGGGMIELYPYQTNPDDTYYNISIFQTRDMNENGTPDTEEGIEGNEATIIGTGDIEVNGVLYFPSNMIHVQGTAQEDVPALGDQLIGWRVEIGGNGEVKINYDGERLPANRSWLVK